MFVKKLLLGTLLILAYALRHVVPLAESSKMMPKSVNCLRISSALAKSLFSRACLRA